LLEALHDGPPPPPEEVPAGAQRAEPEFLPPGLEPPQPPPLLPLPGEAAAEAGAESGAPEDFPPGLEPAVGSPEDCSPAFNVLLPTPQTPTPMAYPGGSISLAQELCCGGSPLAAGTPTTCTPWGASPLAFGFPSWASDMPPFPFSPQLGQSQAAAWLSCGGAPVTMIGDEVGDTGEGKEGQDQEEPGPEGSDQESTTDRSSSADLRSGGASGGGEFAKALADIPGPASAELPPALPLFGMPGDPTVAFPPPMQLPSAGSALHGTGLCRPCAWFWKPVGCQSNEQCTFCHLCLEGALKVRKKSKMAIMRLALSSPTGTPQSSSAMTAAGTPSASGASGSSPLGPRYALSLSALI
jgi:hypothetical protein